MKKYGDYLHPIVFTKRIEGMNRLLPLTCLLGLLCLAGCQSGPQKPLPTAAKVELKRYAGHWHEIARLPTRFQRPGEGATADYRLLPDGRVEVVNTALAPDGKNRSIKGAASVVPGSEGARLRVKFEGIAGLVPASKDGNYWIIALDPNYRHAMVGTPDRDFLWILAREPKLPEPTYQRLVARAKELGFATEKLIKH